VRVSEQYVLVVRKKRKEEWCRFLIEPIEPINDGEKREVKRLRKEHLPQGGASATEKDAQGTSPLGRFLEEVESLYLPEDFNAKKYFCRSAINTKSHQKAVGERKGEEAARREKAQAQVNEDERKAKEDLKMVEKSLKEKNLAVWEQTKRSAKDLKG